MKEEISFVQFCLEQKHSRKNGIECLECSGKGKIVHPDEVRDPIEGHKLSARITCPGCKGSGVIDEEKAYEIYQKELQEFRNRKAEKDHILADAISKLTDEELDVILEEYGLKT